MGIETKPGGRINSVLREPQIIQATKTRPCAKAGLFMLLCTLSTRTISSTYRASSRYRMTSVSISSGYQVSDMRSGPTREFMSNQSRSPEHGFRAGPEGAKDLDIFIIRHPELKFVSFPGTFRTNFRFKRATGKHLNRVWFRELKFATSGTVNMR